MNCMHEKKVNKIGEYNLLYDILNPSKRTKIINTHYYPILYGWMNTRRGRSKFKSFQILLDSRCSSTIVMKSLITKRNPKEEMRCDITRKRVILLPI